MASRKTAPTDEELLAQFEGLEEDVEASSSVPLSSSSSKSKSKAKQKLPSQSKTEAELLAELGSLAQRPTSRPDTPRHQGKSPKRTAMGAGRDSARTSEDRPRRSGESFKSANNEVDTTSASTSARAAEKSPAAESATTQEVPSRGSGGGWWGGLLASASAAVKEIQKNEEAQKWAEQVKANAGVLRGLGGRALPTFQNIIHTLAPPIERHERLQIHSTHDFVGYPALDPLIQDVFSRLMQQVEGGEVVVQGPALQSGNGWNDGPWWRDHSAGQRGMNVVSGLLEGAKLSRANAERYATDFYAGQGGIEAASKHAIEITDETNPVQTSDVFLAIQAVSQGEDLNIMDSAAADTEDSTILFCLTLHDPVHGISFSTTSQPIPKKWVNWLEATSPSDYPELPISNNPDENFGIDPREWAADWLQEVLALCCGIVAQRYIAARLGLPEKSIKAANRESYKRTVEVGGGEASRAGI